MVGIHPGQLYNFSTVASHSPLPNLINNTVHRTTRSSIWASRTGSASISHFTPFPVFEGYVDLTYVEDQD